MATDPNDIFKPTFAMPVIGSAPEGYQLSSTAYYSEVATQTTVTTTMVEILPEQLSPPTNPLEQKGLQVRITNPQAAFQPAAPLPPPADPANPPVLSPFGTLFAMMGGELVYRRSTDPTGLNSLLPEPYASLAAPIQYPDPPDLVTAAWGMLALRVWPDDFNTLQTALGDTPACLMIYYLGVAEPSLEPVLKPVLETIYPKQAYLDHLAAHAQLPAAKQKKPTLREVAETARAVVFPDPPASATPTYDQVIAAYAAAFIAGETSLMVKGGTAIGQAIERAPGGGALEAQVELWFLDAATPQQFLSPVWIISGAPIYDF